MLDNEMMVDGRSQMLRDVYVFQFLALRLKDGPQAAEEVFDLLAGF